MKSFMLLTSLLLGASAKPIKERQTTTQAVISNFSASTNPNGNGATIAYDLALAGLTTHCIYTDATATTHLPAVSQSVCDDASVRWQFHQDPSIPGGGDGRYRIVIIHTPSPPGSGSESEHPTAGFHEWAPTDFPFGNGGETVYRGDTSFAVDFS